MKTEVLKNLSFDRYKACALWYKKDLGSTKISTCSNIFQVLFVNLPKMEMGVEVLEWKTWLGYPTASQPCNTWVSKSVIECVMSLSLNYLTWVEMHRREKCAKNFLAFSALIYVKFVCAINKNFLSKIAFTIDEGPIYQQNDMEENRDYSVGMLEWLMQFCWWHAKLCVRNWY